MKIKFKNQAFQTDAVNAVADLFTGQEKQTSVFSVVQEAQVSLLQTEHGIGNALLIEDGDLLNNMHEVQKRNLLPQTPELSREGYTKKGIKVLSLFFIDKVEKYRTAEGRPGVYAQLFEECYHELLNRPKFAALKDRFPAAVGSVHNGYFSQDKMGIYKNTNGDTLADNDTYNTIMKDKEWLLSFDCPLRFIFSHSALKEGRDNPNVFQVCTLIDQKFTFTCRQKAGRGLRLCVDQEGNRIDDRNINISRTAELHVERQGISHTEREMRTTAMEETPPVLPDILKIVGEKCRIKRSTVRDILTGSGRLTEFTGNPQAFIERCVETINRHRFQLAVDGIRYLRLEREEYFMQEIFDSAGLIANLERNVVPVEHSFTTM